MFGGGKFGKFTLIVYSFSRNLAQLCLMNEALDIPSS